MPNYRSPIYEQFLSLPRRWYPPREIADLMGRSPSSIKSTLEKLTSQGLLAKRKRGNYHYAPIEFILTKPNAEARENYRQYLIRKGAI